MSNNLANVQLYGGAITTLIPQGFLDASMLREVPDTQEVYVNSRSETDKFTDGLGFNESIIIDLLQRVDEDDDKKAFDFHLKEIADLNGSTEWELLKYDNQFPELSTTSAVAQTCIVLETAYKWGKVSEKEIVISCIGLIRLKDVETDVLITVNIPLNSNKHPNETLERLTGTVKDKTLLPNRVATGYNVLLEIVKNFNIKDKSLFA